MPMPMPRVVGVCGRKRAGKDFLADRLVEVGYKKIHIASPWLLAFYATKGYRFESYDEVPQELRAAYRAEIQEQAAFARANDPEVLIRLLDVALAELSPRPVVVSGLRFINEALYFIESGHLVVKVSVDDALRRQRFIESGESLSLFNDPFEVEIPEMPCHIELPGNLPGDYYVPMVAGAYARLREIGEEMRRAA